MKRCMSAALAAFAFSLAATAAQEKIMSIEAADISSLVKTAAKAGELAGYPMFGSMAAMSLAGNPMLETVGGVRDDVGLKAVFYADPALLKGKDGLANYFSSGPDAALLYAPAKTKQEFAAANPEFAEKDGAFDLGGFFLVYSEDGKKAALGFNIAAAKKVLGENAPALEGDALRFAFEKPVIDAIAAQCAENIKALPEDDSSKELFSRQLDFFKCLESCKTALRLDDAGLDLRYVLKLKAGSKFDFYKFPVAGKPFVSTSENAVFAVETGKCSGFDCTSVVKLLDAYVAYFKNGGCKTDWYSSAVKGGDAKITLDIPGAIAYFNGEGKAAVDKLSPEDFIKKNESIFREYQKNALNALSPAGSLVVSVPDVSAKGGIAALYAKILGGKAPAGASQRSVIRLYSAAKTTARALAKTVPPGASQAAAKAALDSLPSDDGAAIASVITRNGDTINCLIRVSAQEIRGISAFCSAAMAFSGVGAVELDDAGDND